MHGSVDFPLSARTLGPLALFFLAHLLGSVGITLVLATAPAIEHALEIGHAGFGLMLAAYYGMLFVCSLPAGWMVDRFVRNRRTSCLVMIGIAGSVGICLLRSARPPGQTSSERSGAYC